MWKIDFTQNTSPIPAYALPIHTFACRCQQKLFAEALAGTGFKFVVVPYVMPGFGLARATSAAFEGADDDVSVMVLLKHGLFTWGATAKVV